MPQTLAQLVRAKHPGAYDDMNDQALEAAVLKKYPGVYDDLPRTSQARTSAPKPAGQSSTDADMDLALATAGAYSPAVAREIGATTADLAIGAGKGAAHTAIGAGRAVHLIPGVDRALGPIPADAEARLGVTPTNATQRVGMEAEQVGEFLVPGGAAERGAAAVTARVAPHFVNAPRLVQVVPRMATQGATNALVAGLQGSDAVTAGAVSAALPAVGAAADGLSPFLRSYAEAMVRTAIKPTVTALKRVAGASTDGLDAKATALVRFILDNRLVNADKARALFNSAETELRALLARSGTAVTDAATRADRYLTALERSAARQGLPASDVAQIRNAAAELMNGPMGRDVVTMVPAPHPTLVGPNGQPITVLTPQTTRALRTDVTAQEALDSARASSRWSTNKTWGEQKGTSTEATKAVERAQRDAVKDAVPGSRELLQTESKAIQATGVLDRMAHRQSNREEIGLPAHALVAGGHGVLALASNLLRNNGLKAGVWVDRLAKAVKTQNVRQAAWILSEMGVGLDAQQENPAYGH